MDKVTDNEKEALNQACMKLDNLPASNDNMVVSSLEGTSLAENQDEEREDNLTEEGSERMEGNG